MLRSVVAQAPGIDLVLHPWHSGDEIDQDEWASGDKRVGPHGAVKGRTFPKVAKWLDQIRNGDQNAMRTVTLTLMNEDHTEAVQTWKLLRARIIKHTSGPLNAKGTDVAMEEMVLAYERLEME